MTVSYDFTDQVALVTGASAGMGLATARAFAEAGASTVLVDINETAVRAAADELAGQGLDVLPIACDVSSETRVAAVIATTVSTYGRLDAAFNNAGIMMPPLKTADTDNATYDRLMAVNLTGVWNSLKHQILQMRKQRFGAIVNNSSIAGLKSGSARSAYTATKHAVLALTKSAALEEGAQGIRVNAVCPGTIETPMVDRMIAAGELDRNASAANSAIPRLGRAEEIADAVLWLCSPGRVLRHRCRATRRRRPSRRLTDRHLTTRRSQPVVPRSRSYKRSGPPAKRHFSLSAGRRLYGTGEWCRKRTGMRFAGGLYDPADDQRENCDWTIRAVGRSTFAAIAISTVGPPTVRMPNSASRPGRHRDASGGGSTFPQGKSLTLARRLKAMGNPKYQSDGDPRTSGPGSRHREPACRKSQPLAVAKPLWRPRLTGECSDSPPLPPARHTPSQHPAASFPGPVSCRRFRGRPTTSNATRPAGSRVIRADDRPSRRTPEGGLSPGRCRLT